MSETYVVGDVHGCLDDFEALLEHVGFRPKKDRLWMVGDIVNRGPESLAMLRRAIKLDNKLGARFVMVLGNHEIHLLKVALGLSRLRAKDTITDILEAPDRGQLLAWLRQRPLVHTEGELLLTHAGLLPHWTGSDAVTVARTLEKRLRKGKGRGLLGRRSASRPLNSLTRIRMLDSRARQAAFSGPPEEAPPGIEPWYKQWVRNREKGESPCKVLFGHWAALGHRTGGKGTRRWISLDTGCVYGRKLTAIRLSDEKVFRTRA